MDITSFSIFMFFWMCVLLFLYIIAGFEVGHQEDYPNVLKEFYMAIQVYRNSYGDISAPSYSHWLENDHITEAGKGFFTAYSWVLFSIHEFFMVIVLLNFLIAIVSQSYDSIMDNEQVETIQSKIYMNDEASIIFDALDVLFRITRVQSNVFHVIADMSEYDDDGDDF